MGKTFKDLRNELGKENPSQFMALEIMGELMNIRYKKGLSQRQLSKMSGVPQKTISNLENGINYPNIETVGRIAYALGMKIALKEME